MTYDLILKGGTVVSPGGMAQTDIGVKGERIAHIGDLTGVDAGEIYDATGLHILPGVIDSQGSLQGTGTGAQGGSRNRSSLCRAGRRRGRVRDAEHKPVHDHARCVD